MILMRLDKVVGSCHIRGYDSLTWAEGGWFPVDSVSFGFNPQSATPESKDGKNPGKGAGNHSPRPSSNGGKDTDEEFTEMRVAKQVDCATANLMTLAMEAKMKPAEKKSKLKADIHFLGSVEGGKSSGIGVHTFLLIHLEAVEIKGWNINGSGESRPTEDITLRYEKAAMCYHGTPDGKTKKPNLTAGWDQSANKQWPISEISSDYFPRYPKN